MGTDIHFYVEVRKDDEWHSADKWADSDWSTEQGAKMIPYADQFYSGRNYDLFAILADVRNGYGFASVETSEGFKIISEPRGFPEDMSRQLATHLLVDCGGGDHSQTYLGLDEILEFDWTQVATKYGVIDLLQFHEWNRYRRGVGSGPESYCGGRFGADIKTISVEEMDALLAELEEKIPTTYQSWDAQRKYLKEEMNAGNLITRVSWCETYSETCSEFWIHAIPKLLRLAPGNPEDVRIVMYFDS